MKPRIFIGSASEARELMQALSLLIHKDGWAITKPWHYATFDPGKPFLASLSENTANIDIAVILYTGEDKVTSRHVTMASPRDNVVFELGYFIARLGADRVFVVCPANIPKIPSDYAGYGLITFHPSDGDPDEMMTPVAQELERQFRKLTQAENQKRTRTGALPASITTNSVDIEYKTSLGGIVPVYRDLSTPIDWYGELEANLRPPYRYVNSKLAYYGPGLAKFWIERARKDAANREMIRRLKEGLYDVLAEYADESLNIIDLGVGDFEKGHIVLDFYLGTPGVQTINYFPLDVSYEMLSVALRTQDEHYAASTLQAVQRRGSIIGINATFSQLHQYNHLFSRPSRNLFLFLGNTLGNESDEIPTLRDIAAGMNAGDLLVTEVQLLERTPPPIEEDRAAIQQHKDFYTGPFRALGFDVRQIDLGIRINSADDERRGVPAVTYEVTCKLQKPLVVKHPAFANRELRVPAEEDVCVHLIRLYKDNAIFDFLGEAGLDVVKSYVTEAESPTARRFEYVVAQKQARSEVA
jgi:hypothetical protein